MAESPFLVIVDADRIHEYVFTPHRLRLVRGGSAIQDELNREGVLRELMDGWGDGNVGPKFCRILKGPELGSNPQQRWEAVYAGGGTTVVLFRVGTEAEEFAAKAADLYWRRSMAATATAAVSEWEGSFLATIREARNRLERNKTARAERWFASGCPYTKPCESCGLFAAMQRNREADGTERFECAACTLRRNSGQRLQYIRMVGKLAHRRLRAAEDFEELAKQSQPDNYLAMVYLDINRLGKYLDEHASGSAAQFRQESRRIQRTVQRGVLRGCAKLCRRVRDGATAPFEILLLGGDDAIVMLAAQGVFDFLEEFQAEFEQSLGHLTFSAGVAWAHHHFPIAQFLALAEELLRSAKGLSARRGAGVRVGEFAVDYTVVAEPLAERIGPRDRPHTSKPYCLKDFLELRTTARKWKGEGFPKTKVRELYEIAHEGRDQGLIDYYFLLSRLKEGHREAVKQFLRGGLWDADGKTKAADLAEVWDFVAEEA